MPKVTKPNTPAIIGYKRNGEIATNPLEALVWGWSEDALPRHGGGCSATWKKPLASAMGENAPKWLYAAERMRRAALRGEQDDS